MQDAGGMQDAVTLCRDAGGMQDVGEVEDAGMLCWDAGRMQYAGTALLGCRGNAGRRQAVPGCRQDACQDMSMLCKATLPLCPGQPGKEPRDLSVPVWGKKSSS